MSGDFFIMMKPATAQPFLLLLFSDDLGQYVSQLCIRSQLSCGFPRGREQGGQEKESDSYDGSRTRAAAATNLSRVLTGWLLSLLD